MTHVDAASHVATMILTRLLWNDKLATDQRLGDVRACPLSAELFP